MKDIQQAGLDAFNECKRLLVSDGIALPKNAWLSGQAFALMVARNLGFYKNEVVINDIDVFKVVHYDLEEKMIEKSQTVAEVQKDYYQSWLGIGEMVKYKVVSTVHEGLINLTNIKYEDHIDDKHHGYELVSRFDINSTQCAINTSTMEVVYTPAYEQFCQTNILRIEDVSTIGHTLIRLVKKQKELQCECDFKKEFEKFSRGEYFNPFFGEEKYKQYIQNKEIFNSLGIQAKEIEFEEREYPLYKFERFAYPIDSYCLRLPTDPLKSSFVYTHNIIECSDLFYGLDDEEFNEELMKVQRLADDEALALSEFDMHYSPLTHKFFNDIDMNLEDFNSLLDSVGKDELYVALVLNNSNTFADAMKWVNILEEDLCHTFIVQEVSKQVNYTRGAITFDEVLANKAKFNWRKLIDEIPNIGCSENKNPVVYGENNFYYFVEAEYKKDGKIELFGAEPNGKGEYVWSSKTLTIEEFEKSIIFNPASCRLADELKITLLTDDSQLMGVFNSGLTVERIPEIDIDEIEIPF